MASCGICAPSMPNWKASLPSESSIGCCRRSARRWKSWGAQGAAGLFWGERATFGEGDNLVRIARTRVDAFQKRVGEVEERRQAVLEDLEQQQEKTELLDDDVFELEEREERRRQEWVLEREVDIFPSGELVMPWSRGGEEDERFRKALRLSALLSLLLALLIPQITLPVPELVEGPLEVPERLARLIVESRPLPPPPPREEIPEPRPSEQPLAAETAKAAPKEGPGIGPGKGPGKGILAFREKFSGFAENQNLARLGSQARISSPGAAPSGVVERSMVTTQAAGSSGGINLAEISRGVVGGGGGGGGKLEGVQVARATSTIGGGGGRGSAASVGGGGAALGRTDEEIQIVFDRHKSALYRLYNRELRNDPTLRGQMVLRIRIEPDGSVTLCELQATDMNAQRLVA